MSTKLRAALGIAGIIMATQAVAQVTFYESENFQGRAFTADKPIWDFASSGFNDRARSAVVNSGNWEVCEDARFQGRCVTLRPGNYQSLGGMGMDKRISSIRPVGANVSYDAPPPLPAPAYEYRERPNERLYQAPVTSVHAVVGPPEQRCWVERQQVAEDRGSANVPGAIVGAIVGGVLGHQVGGGRGNDVATAGGAVAGAAIGANVGRGGQTYTQDVRRCDNVQGYSQPDYWDVTYDFRGVEHRVQLSSAPGPTVTVNENGEPRG